MTNVVLAIVAIVLGALAIVTLKHWLWGKMKTKQLPTPEPERARKALVKKPAGPYRETVEQEGEDLDEEEGELEPEPDFQGCLTAADAALRFQEKEEESISDVANLFKTKVEPDVEDAIKDLKREAFIYPLSPAEIEVLTEYVQKLGYKVSRTDSDSMRIKF